MANFFDVLSESGLRTGEVLSRTDIHRLGKWHRAIHLYIFNSKNEILLQQRSMNVDHYPGGFGISVTGHIEAGEYSTETMRRELREELDIDRQFNDIYIMNMDIESHQIYINSHEVQRVVWIPFARFCEMVFETNSKMGKVYGNEVRDLIYFLEKKQ